MSMYLSKVFQWQVSTLLALATLDDTTSKVTKASKATVATDSMTVALAGISAQNSVCVNTILTI
jgi:hypothetical protein